MRKMKITNITISESYRPVVITGATIQIFLLLLSSLILDGGTFLRIACIGALAFWTSVS